MMVEISTRSLPDIVPHRSGALSDCLGQLLTEVDLCTSLPSGVPEPGRLPCSVTRLQLLGVQGLDCTQKGSSVDQDERLQLEA